MFPLGNGNLSTDDTLYIVIIYYLCMCEFNRFIQHVFLLVAVGDISCSHITNDFVMVMAKEVRVEFVCLCYVQVGL